MSNKNPDQAGGGSACNVYWTDGDDQWCDTECNIPECNWDGRNCCSSTACMGDTVPDDCEGGYHGQYFGGNVWNNCEDPEAIENGGNGVGGFGGTADFDMDTRTALLNLSPQLADIYQGALDRSGLFGGQAMQYAQMDPFEAADLFYQQEQPLVDKARDLRRTDLETRLLSQGRLGGTGGGVAHTNQEF